MRHTTVQVGRDVFVLSWGVAPPVLEGAARVSVGGPASARAILATLARVGRPRLRALLAARAPSCVVGRLDDHQLLDELARRVASSELRLFRARYLEVPLPQGEVPEESAIGPAPQQEEEWAQGSVEPEPEDGEIAAVLEGEALPEEIEAVLEGASEPEELDAALDAAADEDELDASLDADVEPAELDADAQGEVEDEALDAGLDGAIAYEAPPPEQEETPEQASEGAEEEDEQEEGKTRAEAPSGEAATKPRLAVADTLDFGKVPFGGTPALDLKLENTGDAELVLGAITFPSLFRADATNAVKEGDRVAAGASVVLKVEFVPDGLGAKSGDLTIASNDPDHATRTVQLKGELLDATLELFRGGKTLAVVPFSTTDVAQMLDGALPSSAQQVADSSPKWGSSLDATFQFPKNTEYGANDAADKDVAIFRVRVKDLATDGSVPDDLDCVLKVQTSDGKDIVGWNAGRYADIAVHPAGMKITLKRDGSVWRSPYLRVATTVTDISKQADYAIVHSAAPNPPTMPAFVDLAPGKQFGRTLKVTCTVGDKKKEATFTMGGRPFARVPVAVTWIGPGTAVAPRVVVAKLAELNQYWAGQGIEFVPKFPAKLVDTVQPPDRTLIVVGEHTGPAAVSTSDLRVTITVSVTKGSVATPATIQAAIPARSTPKQAADAIASAVTSWSGASPLDGVKLAAAVHSFADPRVLLALSLTPSSRECALPKIGTTGPADVTLKVASGADKVAVTGLVVEKLQPGSPPTFAPDADADIFCPPVDKAFHDPSCNPASAAQRAWVRAFGPPGGDYVSVLVWDRVESAPLKSLCASGFTGIDAESKFDRSLQGLASSTSPISILNFGRWTEPCARFVVFLGKGNFATNTNDLQHELGHTLVDCNHVVSDPDWFYRHELMHASGPAEAKSNQMSRNKVIVDTVEHDGSDWKGKYKDLADGYGGAARARIRSLASRWLVDDDGKPGYPWT